MIEILLLLLIALLLFNYLYFLSEIIIGLKNLHDESTGIIADESVSVIVPFRNESNNILVSLNSLVSQNYPNDRFEVIYVNDSSNDDSYEKILNTPKPLNFKVICVSDFSQDKAFKKKAINFGVEQARGEIIITTDADCVHNPNWLREIISKFDLNTGFISGPVSFIPQKSLFSNIQTLEFAGLVLSGAGLIGIGKPTICNGANLAFRKSIYNKLHGYSDQMHLSSGEDELFMQKVAAETHFSVKFCRAKDSVVYTQPNENIHDFFEQRRRWSSKGLFYRDKFLIVRLILIYLFYLSITTQILLTFFFSKIFFISLMICLILKFILEYKIISHGINFLFEQKLMKYFLITEIFQIFYLTIAGVGGIIGNFKWKDRKLSR